MIADIYVEASPRHLPARGPSSFLHLEHERLEGAYCPPVRVDDRLVRDGSRPLSKIVDEAARLAAERGGRVFISRRPGCTFYQEIGEGTRLVDVPRYCIGMVELQFCREDAD